MHAFPTWTNNALLLLSTVLMGHVVSYLLGLQCPTLATAGTVNTDNRSWFSLWMHLGAALLIMWPQVMVVLLLFLQSQMLNRRTTGGAQGTRSLWHRPWY